MIITGYLDIPGNNSAAHGPIPWPVWHATAECLFEQVLVTYNCNYGVSIKNSGPYITGE